MDRDKIIFWRNFFIRAFVIGLAFAVLFFFLTYGLWNTWAPWSAHWLRIDEKDLARSAFLFFLELRIVLVFLFLVPALALHWTVKKYQP